MATIADVAKLASVSQATVSRVINNKGYFSKEVAHRVLAAVEELSYTPNIHAERLRTGSTKNIALFVPEFTNPCWMEISRGVEDILWKNQYDLILQRLPGDPERSYATSAWLRRRQVDGALVPRLESGWEELKSLENEGTKIVVLGRTEVDYGFDTFGLDNLRGGYLATEHLLKLGHQQIVFISPRQSHPREKGFLMAMESYEACVDEHSIIRESGPTYIQQGKLAVRRIRQWDDIPTAIFAFNDLTAIGVWMELEKHGMRVPEDISIIGFDDIPMANMIRSGLTTMHWSQYEYGSSAAEHLIYRILEDQESTGRTVVIEPRIVMRNSTRSLG